MNSYIVEFGKTAASCRELVAIVDRNGSRNTTYAELDEMRLAVASRLLDMGLAPGTPVIIDMERCREYIAAWLGILTAGCASVPLTPEYPADRVEFIRKDCGAALIIDESFFDDLPAASSDAVRLVPEDTPAHIIYTSGSTGRPKGVLHTVRSVFRMACPGAEYRDVGERQISSAAASLSFIICVYDILAPLSRGGEVHIIDENVRKDAVQLSDYFLKHGVNISYVSAQMLKSFTCKSPKFKKVISGAEVLRDVYSDDFEILNVYGSSEIGIVSCFKVDKSYHNTPVGKPLDDCRFEFVGDELCVETVSASEYVNLPEKSAATFEKRPGGRHLYHTGDHLEMGADGNYVYVNRLDWMVKINGQRVETLGVESVLREVDGIDNAVVKAFTDSDGQTYLCAYYMLAAGREALSEPEIRRAMESHLPPYMIPRFFVKMDSFPINEHGKLDRPAFLPPSAENYKVAFRAPSNEREKAVCDAFDAVLHCGFVGADDDFFALGGDSIKVLKLMAAVKEATGLVLVSSDVLAARTVAGIAARLKDASVISAPDAGPAPVPLTLAQRGVYFDCLENPESTMYNIPFALKLPESVDADRFASAVEAVAAVHPALSATVADDGEGPVLRPGMDRIRVARRSAAADAKEGFVRPFDLENGPLCRLELVQTPDGKVFLLDVHHLVFDGTSLNIFLQQIAEAYEGKPVPEEDMTMFGYAASENGIKEREEYRLAEEFFASRLGEIEYEEAIMHDVAGTDSGAGILEVSAPDTLRPEMVEHFARRNGVTENIVFMSAFSYALSAFAGTTDCCFATADNGRHDDRMSSTVGMFVKMLPMHIGTEEGQSVAAYLYQVRDELFQTMANDCIEFADLSNKYGVRADISFVYQSELLSEVRFGDACVLPEELPVSECQSDIVLMVLRTGSGYKASLHYDKAVFSESMMNSLASTVFSVAAGLLSCERLDEIELVDERSRAFVDGFNRTERPRMAVSSLNEKIEAIFASTPDKDAVVFKDRRYPYAEFERLTRNLAAAISARGIGKDNFVSVLVHRNEYMAIGAWGVVRSGAAFQPLDPSYPQERLEYMVSDSGARLLIADRDLRPLLAAYNGDVIYTDEIASLPDAALPAGPAPEDAITMIYTSGTTGKPKGCVLENRNLTAFCRSHSEIMSIAADSRVASYASFGFDAGVMDVLNTLCAGATLFVIPDEIRLDLAGLEEFFCDNGISSGFMTTQLGRMFALQTKCPTLRSFLFGGEKLVPFTPTGDFDVINGYGPCETMGYICFHKVTDNSPIQPVGKPFPDTKIYIIDKYGRLAPVGALGELCISGLQVGRGYLGLPEKTAQVFVPNPFDGQKKNYARMYRTGDVARLLPAAEIEFVGRRDGQVKVRGFRVELTEVEEVIRRFEGISDATVVAYDDPAGGKYLAAYVVSPSKVDVQKLNAFIKSEKPAYMVPAATMQLDAIPYTQNQKVNRRALPEPQRSAGEVEMIPASTECQKRIFQIAAEVLGHDKFGITSDLFEVGMTSIGLLKFNARLGKEFGKALKISDIKDNGNIKDLEGLLAGEEKSRNWEMREDYPLMQNQQGVFVECSMTGGSTQYNVPLLMRVSGRIDADRLKSAMCRAIDAHPYLKATLKTASDGSVRAVRNDSADAGVEIIRCETLPGASELVRPFNLVGGELYRAKIFVTPGGNYLFFDVHHIISDGTSLGILLNDIDAALAGREVQNETYSGFEAALDEEQLRSGNKMAEARGYFDKLLGGCNTECLPAVCPEAGAAEGGNAQCEYSISHSAEVLAYCRERGLSLNAFFNAAFCYTLSEFIHSEDITYCTVHNGRGDSRLSDSFAMLVRTIPVCASIAADVKSEDFVRSIQKQLLDTMANDALSFAEISNAYGVKSSIFFNYQGDSFVFDKIGGEDAEMIPIELGAAKAPLSFEVFLREGKFSVSVDRRTDMFCREFADSFASALDCAVGGFISGCALGNISLLSESEKRHFDKMNATDTAFRNVSTQQLFEEMADKCPDRVAAISTSGSLTFAELDDKANRLANALISRGVQKDEIVAMILDRSEFVPVAELGIMKAGAAFLPMLPSYPKDRIDFCIKDAGCRIVITDDNLQQMIAEGKPGRPDLPYDRHQLAYCIYTSGSTGTPKGVMIEQHNLSNIIQDTTINRIFDNGHTILCIASISFDLSLSEIILALCHGMTLRIASEHEIHNLDQLQAAFTGSGADSMFITPSFMWSLLSLPEFGKVLGKLQAVLLGAEAFQPALFDKLKELNPDMLIMNGYGPTETTQACSVKLVNDGHNITIGGPIANAKLYVADDRGNLLPRYAVGELIICGEGVGRGYVGLPEKTKASFFEVDGVRAYHSGDLVRINRDGEAEFGGRKDNQVKLRGFRVELDEVEAVMQQFDGVSQSKVIVRNNGKEDFLAGFFTADKPIDIDALTAFMKTKLTYYMVPAAMMQLDRMPMTTGGKLDKKALPEIKPAVKERSSRRKPAKSLEEKILDIFKSVLGLDDCYVDDNFFEVGGTSLSASKAVMLLKSGGYQVEYQDIFDHQTAEELASFVESRKAPAAAATSVDGDMIELEQDETTREALKYNTMEYAPTVERKPLGDVLLTGATGFLGCHILKELLDCEEGHIWCLLRKSGYSDVTMRLREIMFYYFEDRFDEAFENRISVIEGDITDDSLAEKLSTINFDTVINSAACVKHFSNDSSIEFVNVHGVENLIGICMERNARLVQISTTSVPGAHTAETFRMHIKMTEDKLFVVDDMNNQYAKSKFKAEKLILAAVRKGMKGKIVRVGNLMGRHSDGEFQINSRTNSFLNGLKGFARIGKCPFSHATDKMGFSPIDCTAKAVVLLAGTNDCFTAFNADNRWYFDEMKVIEALNNCGIKVVPVQDEEYYADFKAMMADNKRNQDLLSLLAYDRPDVHVIETSNRFTANILYRLGFSWPFTDEDYLQRIISSIDTLGYFD